MNTTLLIKDEKQKKMIDKMEDLFGDGSLYSLNFNCDYKLDEMLKHDISSPIPMLMTASILLDLHPIPATMVPSLGCSCFLCHDTNGHILVGRNYDIKHEMTGILMTSKDQKDSIESFGLVDMGWFSFAKGDLSDGKHDNSVCIFSPYMPVEGMNKEGVVIAVLQLMSKGPHQETGKKKSNTTFMIRHVLDRAHNVNETIEIFASRDMHSMRDGFDYHFFIADKSGRSVVIEYVKNEMNIVETDRVTNFYLSDPTSELRVGKERYDIIDAVLKYRGGRLEMNEVLEVLKLISQPSGCDTGRSNTRWSVVYDLTSLSAEIYTDHCYDRPHKISFEE